MEINDTPLRPLLHHVEPVLAVKDVVETIKYWQEVLGFPAKWTWGEPPDHGGVSWNGTCVQFSLDPVLADRDKGSWMWIRVQRLEMLYEMHKEKGANIVQPLKAQPWGMSEYIVKENNGYYLIFSAPSSDRNTEVTTLPDNIKLIERNPTPAEYLAIMKSVGWLTKTEEEFIEEAERKLSKTLYGVVAENKDNNEVVGCALILGDHESFYYIKDVMVKAEWQHKQVGTAVMRKITQWLEQNGKDKALVALICREALEGFYKQFGFEQSFAMIKYMQR